MPALLPLAWNVWPIVGSRESRGLVKINSRTHVPGIGSAFAPLLRRDLRPNMHSSEASVYTNIEKLLRARSISSWPNHHGCQLKAASNHQAPFPSTAAHFRIFHQYP